MTLPWGHPSQGSGISQLTGLPPTGLCLEPLQAQKMLWLIPVCMQQPQLERSHFFSCAGCLCFLIPVLRLPFLQRASCCVLACWGGCTLTVDFLFRSRHIFSEAPCSWAPRDVFCLQKVSWHLWEQLPGYAVLGIWEPWLLHSALIRIDNNNWHVWSGSSQGSFTAHSSPEGDC